MREVLPLLAFVTHAEDKDEMGEIFLVLLG